MYTLAEISKIIEAENPADESVTVISSLLVDSRNIALPNSTLFFAIKGERHDGATYIGELYKKGVRAFVISEPKKEYTEFKKGTFLLVPNVVKALQKLATHHRNKFTIPIIGITGSNGKTIVKEWLFQMLYKDYTIVRSPKSYNSQIGVPLSVWQLNNTHTLGIFEAGISTPNEMTQLEKIIQPSVGIFTSLGNAHDEGFVNRRQKVVEKLNLVKNCSVFIYCRDYPEIEQNISSKTNRTLLNWSKKDKADLQITTIKKHNNSTTLNALYQKEKCAISIPFTDDASIENAITCWLTLLSFGIKQNVIKERMSQLSGVTMRLELKEGINECIIINDAYNSDIGSLEIALDFLNRQTQHRKKTVILSDILQSGTDQKQFYKQVSTLIKSKGINRFIGIGTIISNHKNYFPSSALFYKNKQDFFKDNPTFRKESILIKGARKFGFEEISNALEKKLHETILEVNLNAISHNLNYFKKKLKKNTRLMAVVKAFSYGSGGVEIATVLQHNRVDYLAVAYVDEGIELRQNGITLPIMVMNPDRHQLDALIRYNLEPEVYSFSFLESIINNAQTTFYSDKLPIKIHIKIDTGMHRLGIELQDINPITDLLNKSKAVTVMSVFSHLTVSDNNTYDSVTKQQITYFEKLSEKFTKRLIQKEKPLRHILNSAGISRFADAQFDMVRLGIGLHGIGCNEKEQQNLENTITLRTIISQIRTVKKGDFIGYGRNAEAKQNMIIATVPIGYADGFDRKLGNGVGKMIVNDNFVKTVGNICMDMTLLDITKTNAKEGDEVIVIGKNNSISKLAAQLNTIPYEILTGISRRVKRVYFQE